MIKGTYPAGRVDPIGVAPAEVVVLAARCELLEAVAEAAREYRAAETALWDSHPSYVVRIRVARRALDAALVAAGATGKAGT